MMPARKEKEEIKIQDRRRFTAEGDLSSTTTSEPIEESKQEEPPTQQTPPTPSPEKGVSTEEIPQPPSAAEQHEQHGHYQAASQKIDSMLDAAGAKRPPNMEVTFEQLIVSLYMQAMMQMGMIREED